MNTPLYVLIAAHGQPELLRRTLRSLSACDRPASFGGVWVIENGTPAGLENIVREFSTRHAMRYLYSPPPNKSVALNMALAEVGDALCVFTDDDVQVPARTLVAYANAARGRAAGEFYGGPIVPDYEARLSPEEAPQPPNWLQRYLPRSAAGWQMSVVGKQEISQAEFIGPNFAAFAADLRRVGGFDTNLGPGTHLPSPGEDTEIQERLLARGVRGYYLPDAPMRHFVRRGNVTQAFALERAERNGIYWGIRAARSAGFFPRIWMKTYGQWLNDRWRIRRWLAAADDETRFRAAFMEARWRGRWQGIGLAPKLARPAGSAVRRAA